MKETLVFNCSKCFWKNFKFLLICKRTEYIVYFLQNTMQGLPETKHKQKSQYALKLTKTKI